MQNYIESNHTKYIVTTKKYNGIEVNEYKPVYNDDREKKEHSQYITQRCIELLKKYNRI